MTIHDYELVINWTLTDICNLTCDYCIQKNPAKTPVLNAFIRLYKSIGKENRKINVITAMNTIDRIEKKARIRLTGGEPFILTNFITLCSRLTENHYIDVESNFILTKRIKEFCHTINPHRVIEINAAFHIKELERINAVDKYIKNYLYCREKGFRIRSFAIAYPPVIKDVIRYKHILNTHDIPLDCYAFIGYYNSKEYPSAYSDELIKKLNINMDSIQNIIPTKRRYCTAGYGFFVINKFGHIYPCYSIKKKLGNIHKGFKSAKPFIKCPFPKCPCDPMLIAPEQFKNVISKEAIPFHV